MYGKVSRSFFLSFLFYIGHGVAAICQFVEIRRHRGSRGIQLGCARLARWQKQRRARLYRCPFPHQLDRQAIQHLHSLTQCLETDKGILRLHSRSVTVQSLAPKFAGDIFLSEDWITCDGRNFLWLPHDYRGTCSASRSNLLVIGQSSGQVHFIECSPLSVIV